MAISWEFGHQEYHHPELYEVNAWENPRIVSILILRHPIDRLLAFDGYASKVHGEVRNRTDQQWWEEANEPVHSNNFALRVLSTSHHCCQGKDTDRKYLEMAKRLVNRMTFVLDQDCLNDNLRELGKQLNLTQYILH